jgi:parallel beta-helix repeat protein
MGRKVALVMATVLFAVVSVVLMGGQSDVGIRWWRTHEPIYIYGDDDFTLKNGVISGSGSQQDPYIIEGWYIDAWDIDYGIYIDHTEAHFVIRGCVIERARDAAIYLNSVTNGNIEKCQVSLSQVGVCFFNANQNRLTNTVIAENCYGVVMTLGSKDNVVYANSFFDNGSSGLDRCSLNSWSGETGNYWSDYSAQDKDGDGVGDQPYYNRFFDPKPLVEPPVERMQVAPMLTGTAGTPVSNKGRMIITSQMPITLTATDPGSGVDKILYSINGDDWREYTGPFTLSGSDGEYTVYYYSVDKLGNAEPSTKLTLVLDNNPPETAISFGSPNYSDEMGTWLTSKTLVMLDLVSASSYGQPKTFYAIDGGPWQRYHCPFHITGPDGPHQVSYYSSNASGITEKVHVVTVLKDDSPPITQQEQGAIEESMCPQSNATTNWVVPEPQEQNEVSVTPQPEASAVVPVVKPEVATPSQTTAKPASNLPDSPDTSSAPTTVQTPSTTD